MRKIICLALVMVFMLSVSLAMADTTSTKWFHAHEYINRDSYQDRYGEFQKKQGLGVEAQAEVVVLRMDILGVPSALSTMGSYDINNNAWRLSTKVSVDISDNPVSNAFKSVFGQ